MSSLSLFPSFYYPFYISAIYIIALYLIEIQISQLILLYFTFWDLLFEQFNYHTLTYNYLHLSALFAKGFSKTHITHNSPPLVLGVTCQQTRLEVEVAVIRVGLVDVTPSTPHIVYKTFK